MGRELKDDLRTTADAVMRDAQRLLEIEADKTSLPDDDPRRIELSEEAIQVAERLASETHVQERLTREATEPDEASTE